MEEILEAYKNGKLTKEQALERLSKLFEGLKDAYYKNGFTEGYSARKNENSGIGYFPGFVEG